MTQTFAWNPPKPQSAIPTGHPDDKYIAPEGTYKVEITSSEERTTKAGDGKYIRIAFGVLEPKKYSNKLIHISYTTENRNEMAVKIGAGELQKLCESSLGFLPEPNIAKILDLLPGKQLNITVAHKEGATRDDGSKWPKSYIIKKYEAVNTPSDTRKVVYQQLTGVSSSSAVMGQPNVRATTHVADPDLDDALPF